jgi:Ca2+/Na+ antiporter
MFYAGQWGGGDSKLLMGLGALYGLGWTWNRAEFLVYFLVNTLIAGGIFGIIWAVVVAIRNYKGFIKEYKRISLKKPVRNAKLVLLVVLLVSIPFFFLLPDLSVRLTIFTLAVVMFFTFYLWVIVKSVEKACMHKYVTPDKLTEGDWIAKEVKYKGKILAGPKDLGIEKKQISLLKKLYKQNKIKKVLIKEGIPFVPSFLIGWIMTLVIGNILGLIT